MSRAERRREQKRKKTSAKATNNTANIERTINLALQHHSAGRLSQAESLYQQILQIDPHQPVALHLLGVVAHQMGQNDKALDLITAALAIAPHYTEAHYNLGSTLKDLGRLDEAADSYRQALTLKPDYGEAHSNLGGVLYELERLEEAVSSYRQAVAIAPNNGRAFSNLGVVLQELGQMEDSFACHRRAVTLGPRDNVFWARLAVSLETLSFGTIDESLLGIFTQLLDCPTVLPTQLVHPILRALDRHPDISRISKRTNSEGSKTDMVYGEAAEQLASIPLLLRIMGLCPLNDLKAERMLTVLRRAMIMDAAQGTEEQRGMAFSAALALNCFTNEYAFYETEEERQAVARLEQRIEALMETGEDVPPFFITALAAYKPLYQFPWAEALKIKGIEDVITRQIAEPLEELLLRDQIPQLTPINNRVSKSVRQQYEENPYPRWIKTAREDTGRAIGDLLSGAPLRFDLADYVSPDRPDILVAGCGTGQHPVITAAKFSNAQVLAVDLSLGSLSYAKRKTEALQVPNIEYAQADIMELGCLEQRFDLIECAGVLHHMDDPIAGWRVLVDLLRPGGLMKIALYSERARQDVIEGRSLIAKAGYTSSPDDIRRCRKDIIDRTKDGDPTMAKICGGGDFFSLSECRDLLFHVQEHRFTLPQIEAALPSLGLTFLGFELGHQGALKAIEPTAGLPLWHAFELENPNTFGGMYQFWCRKNGS